MIPNNLSAPTNPLLLLSVLSQYSWLYRDVHDKVPCYLRRCKFVTKQISSYIFQKACILRTTVYTKNAVNTILVHNIIRIVISYGLNNELVISFLCSLLLSYWNLNFRFYTLALLSILPLYGIEQKKIANEHF